MLMDMLATQLKNVESNPMYTFQKEYNKTLYNDNPRRGMMGLAELEKVDFAKMPELFKTVYGNAADFTFTFVGNIDPATLKPLVEKYIGSLPASSKKKPEPSSPGTGSFVKPKPSPVLPSSHGAIPKKPSPDSQKK